MKFSSAFKFGAAFVVACLFSLNSASANSYEQIKKDGVIRIATEGVYSPFSFHNEKDELMGYDVEIARAVAKKLGVKPKFIEASWDAMLAAFDAGKADVVFNQVSITDERKKKYDYSVPYMLSYSAIVVHKDNNDIKSFADLKGKRSVHSVNSMWIPTVQKYGATVTNDTYFGITCNLTTEDHKSTDGTHFRDLKGFTNNCFPDDFLFELRIQHTLHGIFHFFNHFVDD